MNCRQCQEAFPAGTAFCPKCGAVLQTEQQLVKPDIIEEQVDGFTGTDLDKFDVVWDRLAPWLFKRIPLLMLLGVIAIVVLYFSDNSGTEMWRIEPKGLNHFLAVEANDETAFLLNTDGSLAAIRAEDGTEIWKTQLGGGSKEVQSLAMDDDHLIVALPELLTCLNSSDGSVIWKLPVQPLAVRALLGEGQVVLVVLVVQQARSNQPASGNDLQFQGRASRLVCRGISKGNQLWQFPLPRGQVTQLVGDASHVLCVTVTPPDFQWRPCDVHQGIPREEITSCQNCRWARTTNGGTMVHFLNREKGAARGSANLGRSNVVDAWVESEGIS
jgi:hypothetical protein